MNNDTFVSTDQSVRVRFAPSPTGYLHLGGARTALYNWLWSKKTNGVFILRIEDTDAERSTEESLREILEGLTWLGILWDEGPFLQTANVERHVEAADELLKKDHAYRCFCTKDELEQQRQDAEAKKTAFMYDGRCRRLSEQEIRSRLERDVPFVLRFRVPRDTAETVVFEDAVYGRIEKRCSDIEDFTIVRSDGRPLYILSNAVDDITDRITHVIRGADGLANTPKQVLIYRAIGTPPPVFAHMPLTLDTKRTKLSKRRHGEVVTVAYYRKMGILPWALCNFMALLGWSTPDEREVFSREELVRTFDLTRITRANSVFNYVPGDEKKWTDPKLIHFNEHYLRTMPLDELFPFVKDELRLEDLWDDRYENEDNGWFLKTVDLIRARFHTLKDFSALGRCYWANEYPFDDKAVAKNITKDERLKELLPLLAERTAQVDPFTPDSIESAVRAFADDHQVKAGVIINGARTAVSGQSVGPPLFDLLEAVGRERVVTRLKEAANRFFP
jgi:glutamyl-tRNA synthetase